MVISFSRDALFGRAGRPDLGLAMADQPDELLWLGSRVVLVALLAHCPAHLLLAGSGRSAYAGAFGWLFRGRLVRFGSRCANNDVATAHDCHPLSRNKTTRHGALSCAILVSRARRVMGSGAGAVESVNKAILQVVLPRQPMAERVGRWPTG